MLIFAGKIFNNPLKTIVSFNNKEFIDAFEELEKLRAHYYIAGYIRYEAKDVFLKRDIQSKLPLLYFEVFDNYKLYTPSSEPNNSLRQIHINTQTVMCFDDYQDVILKIKNEIKNGNTYEVNYTHEFLVDCDNADPFELFEYLLPEQQTPYNAFIANQWETILSFSPELFFRIENIPEDNRNLRIITRPMKGTIHRGKTPDEDEKLRQFLANDSKNRAENVMITDLMRNDLGRIANFGSVRVSRLFEVETHTTLHQMTTQVEADINANAGLFDIFAALFPCGSVTGAPKLSTMEIIAKMEACKRNVYCGALGLLSPAVAGEARAVFSVPIRILQKTCDTAIFSYRAGGAIVWDSSPEDEWKETFTKARFLHKNFRLIERMLVENGSMPFFDRHIARLKKSAFFFDFKWNDKLFNLTAEADGIIRILLDKNGDYTVTCHPLIPCASNKIRLSQLSVDSSDIFLYHKTTYRPFFQLDYDVYYDEIFRNERGELTEGSRTNIMLEINGEFWTPPIQSGLLNGIYRQKLLEEGRCKERLLYKEDLETASHIYCMNSVRGIREVILS
ncbi:MAG: bifunctional anthranilate synthase component I family protein/class IV aminotransferase [Spirochaetaceae bacterium]|jgi:para-aminobenzoate synthetase/4-amino-4-deoxychorismate lyase|nr:bifunctional anthranilate synthase component I family protein/class IV aminotransferase [Spirochaetaceae bacterium]